MSEQLPFTIEQFCKWANQGKLMGGKCRNCGKILFPPRPLCDRCLATEFEWKEISQTGNLLTYTIIYVAPTQFQSISPYPVGIIQLEDGLKLPGMIKATALDQIKIGMQLKLEFEMCPAGGQWPQWPRYHFRQT
jgi:uncharacterized OB-fold protein